MAKNKAPKKQCPKCNKMRRKTTFFHHGMIWDHCTYCHGGHMTASAYKKVQDQRKLQKRAKELSGDVSVSFACICIKHPQKCKAETHISGD